MRAIPREQPAGVSVTLAVLLREVEGGPAVLEQLRKVREEIASKGGRTSQARGTAHQWTAEEASAAGKKGSARYAMRKAETQQGRD